MQAMVPPDKPRQGHENETHVTQITEGAEVESPRSTESIQYHLCKRLFDITFASCALVMLSPLMVGIAVAIKLGSPGPIFFGQRRAGSHRVMRKGRIVWSIRSFDFYKFRSMTQNADPSMHVAWIREYVASPQKVVAINGSKLTNDRRVTRIGRLLRKTSLDELPQLWNVLKGDMSLVGPRPVPLYELELYANHHLGRLATPPGITGLWQVRGRGRVPFEQMIQLDIEYVCEASLLFDFKILLLTIPAVVSCRGAE